MKIPTPLTDRYQVKRNAGWLTFTADPNYLNMTGFGTKRIGKLVDGREFQFTIGGHGSALEVKLNDTIRAIIESEALEVIKATSTNSGKAPYPAFNIQNVPSKVLSRILDRVEGAILHTKTQIKLKGK